MISLIGSKVGEGAIRDQAEKSGKQTGDQVPCFFARQDQRRGMQQFSASHSTTWPLPRDFSMPEMQGDSRLKLALRSCRLFSRLGLSARCILSRNDPDVVVVPADVVRVTGFPATPLMMKASRTDVCKRVKCYAKGNAKTQAKTRRVS